LDGQSGSDVVQGVQAIKTEKNYRVASGLSKFKDCSSINPPIVIRLSSEENDQVGLSGKTERGAIK